jgi:hypothetical protein
MKASKRWYDGGSHTLPMLDVNYSTGASVVNNGSQYLVGIHLSRDNQNDKRAGQYSNEHLKIEITLEESRRLVKILSEHIATLEYYAKNAQWPPIGRYDPNRGMTPISR